MSFSSDQPLQANQLSTSIDFPKDQQPFLELLTLTVRRMVDSINTKEGALYLLEEMATFQRWFDTLNTSSFKNGYRSVFQLNPASLIFNHNISGIVQVTNYWAIANTAADFRKVPYTDVVNVTNQISMRVTATQVIITNGATAPAITGGIIVLEYLKN